MKLFYACSASTCVVLILLLLLYPVILSFIRSKSPKFEIYYHSVIALGLSFYISMMLLLLSLILPINMTVTILPWTNTDVFDMDISLQFDLYSVMFMPVALYVTWQILEFAYTYMHADPQINRFFKYLLIFMTAMIIFVTANNLLQLFIGWEIMGIMSFLLIGWWHGRADANIAALQAMIYNRVGDIGLIYAMAWFAIIHNSWDIQHIFQLPQNEKINLPLIALIIAATGKSAQFSLHPWLPSAMEGPTPVSALLHSSTMVVAGIFLLVRMNPLMEFNPTILTICLCLGALTTFFSALCALTQNDIKKIVAFSTSSQLGLMMVAIGLNQPDLAFLHICTHAFFKALLFLCSGSFIHSLNGEQDIRKMGGMLYLMPITSSCFTLSILSLMGVPFMTGFFSKDTILEAMSASYVNIWAITLTLMATSFTAVYSLRLIFFVLMGRPRTKPVSTMNEHDPYAIKPLVRLAVASIITGCLLVHYMVPPKMPVITMPPILKLAALIVSLIGFVIALGLAFMANKQLKPKPPSGPHHFSNMLGFFPTIIHRFIPKIILTMAQKIASKMIDQTWLKKTGPKAASNINKPLATTTSNVQRGMIKPYITLFLLTLTIAGILVYFTIF
ncbi:NADH dehydrogenase subunit 5 (mitochondrion) [Betta splendens]|nr:NADH dehydrogenase subunit 5 [Betta splendens]YP_009947891.1 NADH dehydrogenase subunit 5 [Betta mahachaiensis]QOH97059.1 NADH dehydrogenase subunit 5 [Betta mahachaiensis]BAQ35538.1 NADH dehydrogenase subunit 5 [Betta splendens]